MKLFLSFIRKEFWHVLRDTRSLTILLGMPVMMMLLFGFALTSEVKNSNIGILDLSHDESTILLANRFEQSRYFSVVKKLKRESEISDEFKKNSLRMVIIFPPDFRENLAHTHQTQVRLIGDATDSNTSNIMINYATAILSDYQNEVLGEQKLPYQINVENSMLYNPKLSSTFTFVPGVMTLILMILGAMMTSVSIVKEKEKGTMEILLVSPMKPLMAVISKAIPYLLLCFIDVLLILLLAYTVLDMPLRGNIFLLLAESVLFIFTALSLGLLISNVVDKQQTAMFISLVGLLMPALIFTGFMFPLENMPKGLQIISNVIPTKWYYIIVRSIMVKGLGIKFIWKETLILFGMTVFLLGMALKNFKIRLE
jgi:ABC-2 type transport system permease protein